MMGTQHTVNYFNSAAIEIVAGKRTGTVCVVLPCGQRADFKAEEMKKLLERLTVCLT